jgi:hypothetical protein
MRLFALCQFGTAYRLYRPKVLECQRTASVPEWLLTLCWTIPLGWGVRTMPPLFQREAEAFCSCWLRWRIPGFACANGLGPFNSQTIRLGLQPFLPLTDFPLILSPPNYEFVRDLSRFCWQINTIYSACRISSPSFLYPLLHSL